MSRKKRFLILVPIIILGLAFILLAPSIGRDPVPMPIAPDRITEPGTYALGEGRLLQVVESEEGVDYLEGYEEAGESDSSFIQTSSYSLTIVQSLTLEAGWNIEFTPPDQIRITSGTGEVVQRTFGTPPLPEASAHTKEPVIRRKDSNTKKQNKSEQATQGKPSD